VRSIAGLVAGLVAGLLAVGVIVSSCSSSAGPSSTAPLATTPAPLQLIIDHPDAPPGDTFEVFVCDVPLPTTDPLYGDLPLRISLDAGLIAAQMNYGVTAYFAALSKGLYKPHFTEGTTLAMSTDETHDQCVERALDRSSADAAAVMVVATAENLATDPGGWGRPGMPCDTTFCPAAQTRRAMYIGASDFFNSADPTGVIPVFSPLRDLIEHEIGHTLDLPHSGDVDDEHASALDLMSNSAAPRDGQPDRLDAQDTIAINRLAVGWLPESAVVVPVADGGLFELAPSTGGAGQRLLVLPIDDTRFLTVEYLRPQGYDDFLPAGGLAVHLIDQSPAACEHEAGGALCTGIDRRQIVLGSSAPHLKLLRNAESISTFEGWTITLLQDIGIDSSVAQVEVHRTDG
jgi:hypothetical protein